MATEWIRSESGEQVHAVRERIEEIVTEQVAVTGADVRLDVVATREPGDSVNTTRLEPRFFKTHR